jgi:maltose alpha-D-glucosyltransferase/alpha-amylase
MLSAAERTFWRIRQLIDDIGSRAPTALLDILAHHRDLQRFFRPVKDHRIEATRIRCHGDLRLGTFLHSGEDVLVGDFEGEFQRPLSERRIKRCPLRDVASVLASIHDLSYAALLDGADLPQANERKRVVEPVARFTRHWLQLAFLREYLPAAVQHGLAPAEHASQQILLDTFLLERSMIDLRNALRNHPERVSVPARAILDLLASEPEASPSSPR